MLAPTPPAERPKRSSHLSLRGRLALLVATAVIPLIAFGVIGIYLNYKTERTEAGTRALELARSMASAVERELQKATAGLQALALSPSLQVGDFEGFRRQAQAYVDRQYPGAMLSLADASGQQILNLLVPPGQPLPLRTDLNLVRRVFETGQPGVSNLVTGAITKRLAMTVNVPVFRDGQVVYDLALGPPLDTFAAIIREQRPNPGWVVSVFDAAGVNVARTPNPERFVGRRASDQLYPLLITQAEGIAETTSLEGTRILTVFSHVPSGWSVGIGVPVAELTAPLWQSLAFALLGGLLLLLLSLVLSRAVANQILGPITALGRLAITPNTAELQPLLTGLPEVDDIARALVSAHTAQREAEAATRENEARHQFIVENATDYAILTLDLAGRFTEWNAGAENVLGWPRTEVLGQSAALIFTPEDREAGAPEAEMGTALAQGRAPDDRWHMRRDGTRFFASGALLPMRDAAGTLLGFLKILRDRTKERVAEEAQSAHSETLTRLVGERTSELVTANERLLAEAAQRERAEEQLRQAQKMEAVGRLTGGIAHDFNNLLTIIVGSLDMLQRRFANGDDARAQRLIAQAIAGANRAATLTYRLLAFSRQHPLAPEPIDANKLVAGMSDMLRRTLGENIAVETVLGGGLWRTHADPNQLENALLNLAVNARDAMPDSGRLTIETANAHLDEAYAATYEEVTPGQYVLIAVCDTGSGMTPEVIARVFEPFFTTKPVGKGTGLGLSQVYGFAKQSHGHIAIYSEIGHGTTVKLYLPRFRQVGEEQERPLTIVKQPVPALIKARTAGETILVVEDEAMVREFSVSALEEAGYRVIAAEDGVRGLALLDAHPETVLLFTDVVLTGPLNGRKVADEALKRRPDLKVLFTTGYTRNAIIHHGRLDEDVELLSKPFTAASLTKKVRDII